MMNLRPCFAPCALEICRLILQGFRSVFHAVWIRQTLGTSCCRMNTSSAKQVLGNESQRGLHLEGMSMLAQMILRLVSMP